MLYLLLQLRSSGQDLFCRMLASTLPAFTRRDGLWVGPELFFFSPSNLDIGRAESCSSPLIGDAIPPRNIQVSYFSRKHRRVMPRLEVSSPSKAGCPFEPVDCSSTLHNQGIDQNVASDNLI